MKTIYISNNGVDIIKLNEEVEVPFHENIFTDLGEMCIGLFTDPMQLQPVATERIGGFHGVENGRIYSFPMVFAHSSKKSAEKKLEYSSDTVKRLNAKYGGEYIYCHTGTPSSVIDMLN